MPWNYVLSRVEIANHAQLAVLNKNKPEAFVPQKYWGKPWKTVFSALPQLAEGMVSSSPTRISDDLAVPLNALMTEVKNLSQALKKIKGGNTYQISGIKMDDVVDEIKRRDRLEELLGGDM